MKLPALALDIVQGILEGDLLVGFRADITRHGVLDRLEIKEIQRIFQRGNELPDLLDNDDVSAVMQCAVDLAELDGVMIEFRLPELFKGHRTGIIAAQLLIKMHVDKIEHVRFRQFPRAVSPIGADIRLMAGHGKIDGRLVGLIKIPLGDKEQFFNLPALLSGGLRNVGNTEELVELQLAVEHVPVVYDDKISAGHVDSAVLQHVLLKRDICGINLPLTVSGALDLVYRPAAVLLFEDIDGAVEPVIRERRLADDRCAAIHLGFGRFDHPFKVELFAVVRGHFDEITEKSHGKVADLAALFHYGKGRFIYDLQLRLILLKPGELRTLPQRAVFGFGEMQCVHTVTSFSYRICHSI